jgi:hypothetical protein
MRTYCHSCGGEVSPDAHFAYIGFSWHLDCLVFTLLRWLRALDNGNREFETVLQSLGVDTGLRLVRKVVGRHDG